MFNFKQYHFYRYRNFEIISIENPFKNIKFMKYRNCGKNLAGKEFLAIRLLEIHVEVFCKIIEQKSIKNKSRLTRLAAIRK